MKKILLLTLFLANSMFAMEVGEIAMLRGDALVVRKGNDLSAKIQMPIKDKDTIKTKKESKVQVKFQDETVITIGSETVFEVEEYLYEEKNSKANFNVNRGSFKVITGKIGKLAPKSFLLKTKTSLIGIRGTIFAGEVGRDEANGDYIACIKGSIVITSLVTKESFELGHGEMIFIGNDGKLNKPEKLNIDQFIAFSHLENVYQNIQVPSQKERENFTQLTSNTQNATANEEKTTKHEREISLNNKSPQNDINTLIDKKVTATYKGNLQGSSKGEYVTTASTVKLKADITADMDMQVDFGNKDPLKLNIHNQKLDIKEANINGKDATSSELLELNQQVLSTSQLPVAMEMEQKIDANNLKISGKHEKVANGLTTKVELDGTFKDNLANQITGTLEEETEGQTSGVHFDREIKATFDVSKN